MAIFFTSDLHLGHERALSDRPEFRDIREHDEFLIEQWNKKVTKKDEIYILGDLSFRSPHPIEHYLSRMNGRKHLIIGNHDGYWMHHVADLSEHFESVEHLKIIKFEKKRITLCHYPMLEWPGSRYVESGSSFLIHGHIHGDTHSPAYRHIRYFQPHALNAGVDVNHFQPVTFAELQENTRIWYHRDEKDELGPF